MEQLFIYEFAQTLMNKLLKTLLNRVFQPTKEDEKATELLSANRNLLDNMARLLIERETIYQDEVDMLMEGKDVKTIEEYMEKRDAERAANPFKRTDAKLKEEEKAAAEKEAEKENSENAENTENTENTENKETADGEEKD